jgi:hypothetical protein
MRKNALPQSNSSVNILTITKTSIYHLSRSCVGHVMSLNTSIVTQHHKYLKHRNTCFKFLVPKTALRKKTRYASLATGKTTMVF